MDEPPACDAELLHGFFDRAARLHADRVALEIPPGPGRPERVTATYAELEQRSDAVASRLAPLVAGECIVAILLPRDSADLVAAQLGALKAGAAYTCLDPSFPDAHARFVLDDAGAVALLTDARGAARFPERRALVVADIPAAAEPAPRPDVDPSRLAYVIYTSGTTGQPKGVEIEHKSIVNLVRADRDTFRLTPSDRVALVSSPAYDSSIEEAWLAFATGATLVVMDDDAARLGPDLVAWLRRERVSVFCPPPTLLRATGCVDPEAALPDLRLLYVGGEALPDDLAARWARGRWMENGYGPTECTVTVVRGRVRGGEPVAIGRPVAGHRAFVLDDAGNDVAAGEPGELCIAGAGLARGYRNRPALTAERFPVHPRHGRLYRTGDLVRRDAAGNLFYLGRIDAQVKLRGYRIELGAIEQHLAACPGVREAACRVQDDGVLAAFVVAERAAAPPDFDGLAARLRAALPPYMVPSRFGVLDQLPTSVGGKLDRAALPVLEVARNRARTPPRDDVERRIAAAFDAALGGGAAGIDDDFFLDLGGDSLAAAGVVSDLRGDARTESLTVRDLYEARTVAALAERAESGAAPPADVSPRAAASAPVAAATAVQCAVLVGGLGAGAAVGYAVAFVVLPFLLRALGIPVFLFVLPWAAFFVALIYAPVALGIAVAAKKLLVGTYRPLRAPVWGSFFVRNWLVQLAVRAVPWGLLQGTVFQSAALRALGARIGRRVHIHRGVDLLRGGWDLLDIGDDATLGQGASLRLVELEAGEIVVAPVRVGAASTLDVRASVDGHGVVGAGSFLAALSWLPAGGRVPDGERWDGVPAQPAGAAPPPDDAGAGHALTPVGHGVAMILARSVATFFLSLPALGLLAGLAAWRDLDAERVLAWLYAAEFDGVALLLVAIAAAVPLSLAFGGLVSRLLGTVPSGAMSRWSPAYIRVWLKTGIVAAAGTWLSGTVYWPVWLRLAGMRVGRRCEISTIIDVVPERTAIGDESFLADGIYLAGPRVHRGVVTVATTRLGRNTFLGNHVVVPAGQTFPDDYFVGVCTVTDAAAARPGSAWFGHPPFELPRRRADDADRRLTHEPGIARRVTRLFWETLRFALPVVPLLIFLAWFGGVAAAEPGRREPAFWLLVLPVATFAAAAAACLWVVALKWFLLGRVRPGRHPLWSCWCSRWDFLYVAWGRHARALFSILEGTLLLAWMLRAMGARIGRRVVLGAGFAQVVDPDMLRLDDGATVCGMFQAHTFEDRVLKVGPVRIRRGATVAAGAVLFYGADIGEGAVVAPHGVVMKNERLPAGRTYAGCPTSASAR